MRDYVILRRVSGHDATTRALVFLFSLSFAALGLLAAWDAS